MSNSWYLYVVECADDTLYTGITTDTERRVHEHNHTSRAARYTRARRPVRLVARWPYPGRSEASRAEYAFKQLERSEKQRRVVDDDPPTI